MTWNVEEADRQGPLYLLGTRGILGLTSTGSLIIAKLQPLYGG